MAISDCAASVTARVLGRAMRAIVVQNDLVALTILLDKGADIYELIYRPRAMDVLWKSRAGLKQPGSGVPTVFESEAAWLDAYPGGWQEIFPSGGGPCNHMGVELNFHGEASISPWEYEVVEAGPEVVSVRLFTRLRRSPFFIERLLRLEHGRADVKIHERIVNEGAEPMDFMWGHHPAYGAPFLSGACRIDAGARTFQVDAQYAGSANPLHPGTSFAWPMAGEGAAAVDMRRVPGPETPRDAYGYLTDFTEGWCAITNTELGFGVGMAWPCDQFPYAWLWQEMHASPGFPFYREAYVMALEPFTSIPGYGLTAAMAAGTHRTLAAGQATEADLTVVFYEGSDPVAHIGMDGAVTQTPVGGS